MLSNELYCRSYWSDVTPITNTYLLTFKYALNQNIRKITVKGFKLSMHFYAPISNKQ
jgi:hypothetical protein